jgi:hypothetical protein
MVKKPCCARTRPEPLQVGQLTGFDPASAPLAGLALRQRRHAHARLLALEGVFEADLEVVAQIAAAPRPLAALAADEIAEHLVEDVGEAGGAEAEAGAAARPVAAILEGGVAEAVIGGALLLVLQDLVGLAQLLELVLGRLVAGVAVGMVLHRQLAIRLLDVLGAGPAPHPKRLVKILLSHRSPKPCRQAANSRTNENPLPHCGRGQGEGLQQS